MTLICKPRSKYPTSRPTLAQKGAAQPSAAGIEGDTRLLTLVPLDEFLLAGELIPVLIHPAHGRSSWGGPAKHPRRPPPGRSVFIPHLRRGFRARRSMPGHDELEERGSRVGPGHQHRQPPPGRRPQPRLAAVEGVEPA